MTPALYSAQIINAGRALAGQPYSDVFTWNAKRTCVTTRPVLSRACHVTFPIVFVQPYIELDTLSPLLFTLGFSQTRTLTRSNASRVLLQRQTVNYWKNLRLTVPVKGRTGGAKEIERVWLTCSTSHMAEGK